MSRKSLTQRWADQVELPANDEGCWEWTGEHKPEGYSVFFVGGVRRKVPAHRFGYEMFFGSVPAHLQIDHLCRNRGCVNPAHLEPVTQRENLLRGVGFAAKNASRTHCLRGHPFDDENTYVLSYNNRYGRTKRQCRECHRTRKRIRRAMGSRD